MQIDPLTNTEKQTQTQTLKHFYCRVFTIILFAKAITTILTPHKD